MSKIVLPLLLPLALAMPIAAHALPPDASDIAVAIHRDGEAYVVDVDFVVEATAQQVWDVLTDYDHMADFVSNVAASRIVGHDPEKIEVEQTSRLGFGPFELTFENVRAIELVPLREIRSRLVRGDMKASSFTTSLRPEGSATRVVNHGRFTPDRWIPPLIGVAVLESETRKQFAELRAEILRRAGRSAARTP
jgi:ribosome-associated toxin RatA of RatAB toxin-antitoxin module